MSPERQQQIETVFQTARHLAPESRAEFLETTCGEDDELRGEVENRLSRELNDGTIVLSGDDFPDETDAMIGKQVGAYRLTQPIGRGGMGTVYEAVRADNAFDRKVAVKFVKRGMDTDLILKRFRNERQILAALNHPFIARLLDGGTTSDGLPYFVMEFIEGEPLYRFCNAKKLGLTERLELFAQICDAVEEAHQNKVVHRDLKPSNILVKADGTPKLLDFGIAKLLDPELAAATLEPTATHMRMMTPEYAAPEQICGEAVTPATDIYSLGVLLYELISGQRPYRFRSRAIHEISRVICEEEPAPPSLVTDAGFGISDLNYVSAERKQRKNANSLDRIVLKALRKTAAERYQTAADLRDDVKRFLENQPVAAEVFPVLKTTVLTSEPTSAEVLPDKQAVAILPFKMLTLVLPGNTGDEYLGIGLADALILRLSQVNRLVLRPTSSVLKFGSAADPIEAGKDLGVDFVVDGNIRRAGERIRVTVQLLNVADGSTQWAQAFDEKAADVLELEDSISEKVAKSLIPKLTGTERKQLEKRGTSNAAAYEAHLRGRFFWNKFTPDAFPKALESFRAAIALDPDYAHAYAGIADFYNWANIFGLIPAPECHFQAKKAALKALEIDPDLPEACAALGFVIAFGEYNIDEGRRLFVKAIEINPNFALAHEWYSTTMMASGNFDEGCRRVKYAEELEPLSTRAMALTAWTLYQARRYDEALKKARQIKDFDKNFWQGYVQSANSLLELGNAADALTNIEEANRLAPNSEIALYVYCFALVALNRAEEAREILRRLKEIAQTRYVKPYFLAMAHVALGETEAALEYFEESVKEGGGWLCWLGTEPKLDSLRNNEIFKDMLRRTNNHWAVNRSLP